MFRLLPWSSGTLASGKCLHDEYLSICRDGIAQPLPISDRLAIHEDRHVMADRTLVVQDVAAEPRILSKGLGQHFSDG